MAKKKKAAPQIARPISRSENLYRRIHPDSWHERPRRIPLDAFDMPDMSVNREAGGGYAPLLEEKPGWGVVRFANRDVPQRLTHDGYLTHEFRVQPDPEPKNPAHCEIRAYENGQHVTQTDEATGALWFNLRTRLREACETEVAPDRQAYDDHSEMIGIYMARER